MKSLVWVVAVLGLCSGVATAQTWDDDTTANLIPPTAIARQSSVSQGLVAGLPVERLHPTTYRDPSGTTISVTKVRSGEGPDLLWQIRWDPGLPWAPGTWVVFRDGLGRLRELRIILLAGTDGSDNSLNQPGSWVRLVPQARGGGSTLDLFLAGRLVTGGWPVPKSLLELIQSDDSWLWQETEANLPWESLVPLRRWEDERVESFRSQVRKLMSAVPIRSLSLWWPDSTGNSQGASPTGAPMGSWVALDNTPSLPGLGPWGVTLWASTAILRGWGGSWYSRAELLEPRSHLPGYSLALAPDNPIQAPGFGLDWIRNLGLAVNKVLYPSRPLPDNAADVTSVPFLTAMTPSGFAVADLPALVHLLAVSKPGTVYLAVLSVQESVKGVSSSIRYEAPALMIPWVGDDQQVHVVFYAGPREQTASQWLAEFPSSAPGVRPDHVALVALPLPSDPAFPLLPQASFSSMN